MDIPHTGWIDGEGRLVSTHRWPEFQGELRRFHPDLGLAFDRRQECFVIYRRDTEVRRVQLAHGEFLSYCRPVYTVVKDLVWFVDDPEKPGLTYTVMRAPGPWLMAEFYGWMKRGERSRFTHDNSEWANRAIPRIGMEMEQRRLARTRKAVREECEELGRAMDPSDPLRTNPMSGWVPAGKDVGGKG